MTDSQTELVVRAATTIALPKAEAFDLFGKGMEKWWPGDTHVLGEPPARPVLETRTGGRWYQVATDGSECDWGLVRDYQAGDRMVLAWMISPDWAFDPDESRATEVEVTFTAVDGGTRVDVVHRGFEALGDRAEEAIAGDGGWRHLLDLYAAAT